ncbi:hypothetical protein KC355_g21917, partial [Hortaea werneckii]
ESKSEKAAGKSASKDQTDKPSENAESSGEEQRQSTSEVRRQNLTRQMSSLLEDPSREDPEKQDEEARRLDQREIEDDYRETEGDEQGREIEHLILVTHGIGQRLGLRLESVNFVHDVNTLRNMCTRRRKGMSNEEFEDLWASALGEIQNVEEVVSGTDGYSAQPGQEESSPSAPPPSPASPSLAQSDDTSERHLDNIFGSL